MANSRIQKINFRSQLNELGSYTFTSFGIYTIFKFRKRYYVYDTRPINALGKGTYGTVFPVHEINYQTGKVIDDPPKKYVVKQFNEEERRRLLELEVAGFRFVGREAWRVDNSHILMEYLPGEDLLIIDSIDANFCTPNRNIYGLPFDKRILLAYRIALAFQEFLDPKGKNLAFFNYDIKEQNIKIEMIRNGDEITDFKVHILDFGISKYLPSKDPRKLYPSASYGSRSSNPPEFFYGVAGHKSNVYALTKVLGTLITNQEIAKTRNAANRLRSPKYDSSASKYFEKERHDALDGFYDFSFVKDNFVPLEFPIPQQVIIDFFNRMQDPEYNRRPSLKEVAVFFEELHKVCQSYNQTYDIAKDQKKPSDCTLPNAESKPTIIKQLATKLPNAVNPLLRNFLDQKTDADKKVFFKKLTPAIRAELYRHIIQDKRAIEQEINESYDQVFKALVSAIHDQSTERDCYAYILKYIDILPDDLRIHLYLKVANLNKPEVDLSKIILPPTLSELITEYLVKNRKADIHFEPPLMIRPNIILDDNTSEQSRKTLVFFRLLHYAISLLPRVFVTGDTKTQDSKPIDATIVKEYEFAIIKMRLINLGNPFVILYNFINLADDNERKAFLAKTTKEEKLLLYRSINSTRGKAALSEKQSHFNQLICNDLLKDVEDYANKKIQLINQLRGQYKNVPDLSNEEKRRGNRVGYDDYEGYFFCGGYTNGQKCEAAQWFIKTVTENKLSELYKPANAEKFQALKSGRLGDKTGWIINSFGKDRQSSQYQPIQVVPHTLIPN